MSDTVQIALITGMTTIVVTLVTVLFNKVSSKIESIHVDINSRLSELVLTSKQAAHAEGKAEGVTEERAKTEVTLKVADPLPLKVIEPDIKSHL